jgi:hypothetical protein
VLADYIPFVFRRDTGLGVRYLGSSALVYEWFTDKVQRSPSMTLFDIDIGVCHDLFEYYALVHEADSVLLSSAGRNFACPPLLWSSLGDREKLMIVHGDGYKLFPQFLDKGLRPDLVLVDPPKIEIEIKAGSRR